MISISFQFQTLLIYYEVILTGVSKTKGPQTQIRRCMGNRSQYVLNRMNGL